MRKNCHRRTFYKTTTKKLFQYFPYFLLVSFNYEKKTCWLRSFWKNKGNFCGKSINHFLLSWHIQPSASPVFPVIVSLIFLHFFTLTSFSTGIIFPSTWLTVFFFALKKTTRKYCRSGTSLFFSSIPQCYHLMNIFCQFPLHKRLHKI